MDVLIQQAVQESMREQEAAEQAEQAFDMSQEARNDERKKRIDDIAERLYAWIHEEYKTVDYKAEDEFLSQMAMSGNDLNKAVVKAMKQILDADTPKDLGDAESEGKLRLPIKGTGMSLIYSVNQEKIVFIRFTDAETLKELEREREEKKKLELKLGEMQEEYDESIAKIMQESHNKIIRDREIRDWLNRALNETKKELDILSPWMKGYVVDEKFCSKLDRLVQAGVIVKILYGIQERSKGRGVDPDTQEIAQRLRKRYGKYDNFHMKETNSHGKMLLCDDRFFLMTSFNFLSFSGDYTRKNTRGETGICSEDKRNIDELRKKYFSF